MRLVKTIIHLFKNTLFLPVYISPACLPPWDPEPMNQQLSNNQFPLMLQAAGWGATIEASSSATKMHVSLPMINRTECERLMRSEGMFQDLWHTQVKRD